MFLLCISAYPAALRCVPGSPYADWSVGSSSAGQQQTVAMTWDCRCWQRWPSLPEGWRDGTKRALGSPGTQGQRFYLPPDCTHFLLRHLLNWTNTSPKKHQLQMEPCRGQSYWFVTDWFNYNTQIFTCCMFTKGSQLLQDGLAWNLVVQNTAVLF